MAYRDVVLTDTPIEYWEFNETSGTSAASTGSSPHAATHQGGAAVNSAGIISKGVYYDGVDDLTVTPTTVTDFMAGTNFSVEMWVRYDGTASNDYPTFFRRDGAGKTFLVRSRSTSVGQANIIETYFNGRTVYTGSITFNDNLWHHVVVTKASTTVRLFVDNVEYTSATGTATAGGSGATTGAIGRGLGAGEYFKGGIDEVAIYNTALTPTRIAAHYNAAFVNGGYTAQAVTASATMPDAVAVGNTQKLAITQSAYLTSTPSKTTPAAIIRAASVDGTQAGTPLYRTLIKTAAKVGSEYETAKTLTLTTSDPVSTPVGVHIYSITSDWDESTVTFGTMPSMTYVRTTGQLTIADETAFNIDITGADIGYGVALALDWTGPINFRSTADATTAKRPYATLVTQPATPGGYTAQPMTASAVMPPHTASAGTGVSPSISPMTANATLVNPTFGAGQSVNTTAQAFYASEVMPNAVVTVQADNTVAAESMDAYVTWPTTSGFALNVTNAAQAMTANADTLDAAVITQRGPRIVAEPMVAVSEWKQPATINGQPILASEVDDKFFQRVYAEAPTSWFRLNDAGTTAVDRMEDSVDTTLAYYSGGVLTGRHDGPDGRGSVRFLGNGYFREHNELGNIDISNSINRYATLEFYVRTDKQNQFLMISGDTTPTTGMLYVKNGRIHQKDLTIATGAVRDAFTGSTNIADGNWHQIVLAYQRGQNQNDVTDGLYVYVDGKFELRRWISATPWVGIPDYIGAIPTGAYINPGVAPYFAPSVPSSENFVGDMSEVIYYDQSLTGHSLSRHYYDFMGWNPIEASSMDAFAFTPAGASGRGNQKRALYLWWDEAVDAYNVLGGQAFTGDMNHDPVLAGHGVYNGVYDLEGYKVFSKSVTMADVSYQYRDNIYDQPTLIDLETHVDINDYDVIMFGDWPDEGVEEDYLNNHLPRYAADKERLLRQLRDANDRGVGLMVTHPRMAVDLGIIDRVEFIPTYKEFKFSPLQGNAGSLYDYGSAVKFPWNITSDAGLGGFNLGAVGTGAAQNTDPSFLSSKAFFYDDMNFNNKFRVRALVEGLTDIPSYMIRDAVYHVDRDVYGDTVSALDLIDRRSGLVIGDEFIFHGTNPASMDWGSDNYDGERVGRSRGYYAVPPANVKAGTVVTTFGATFWHNQSEVANPFKDYATTIVLDRGEVVGGRSVGGRIFVSFTEQPNRFNLTLPANVLPGSEWDDGTAVWPNSYPIETSAQRNWEFSETRISATNTPLSGRLVETTVTMPDGTVSTSRGTSSGGLIYANYTNLFDLAVVPKWDMTRRGLWWVGRGETPNEGDVRVGAEPMNATAQMPSPVVTAQRDGGYNAAPMVALAQMTRVKEDTTGDATVVTLPMTAEATWTGYSRVISAGPMEATAEFVENFDMVHATGEQVVLTLHGVDATLYLKEEN